MTTSIIGQASDVELFVLAPIGLIVWWALRCFINNIRDRRIERERYGPIEDPETREFMKQWLDQLNATRTTNHKDQQ